MKTFFIGLSDKLLIVRETIEGFKFASHLQGTRPSRLAFDPQDDKRIYCATNGSGL